jgi:hypothetical protein
MKTKRITKEFDQWQAYVNGKAFLGYSKRKRMYVIKKYRKKKW